MGKAIDSILSAPPLQRISPAAREAIANVEALANQQSNAPADAAQFTPFTQAETGVSCSLSLNPEAGTLSVLSEHLLNVQAEKLGPRFNITIKF